MAERSQTESKNKQNHIYNFPLKQIPKLSVTDELANELIKRKVRK